MKNAAKTEINSALGIKSLRKKIEEFYTGLTDSAPDSPDEKIVRFEAEIGEFDSLTWLQRQRTQVKTYWSDREHTLEVAGVGEADVAVGDIHAPIDYSALLVRLRKFLLPGDEDIRYFGGIRFCENHLHDLTWTEFGAYRFSVPEFEIITQGGTTRFACNVLYSHSDGPEDRLHRLLDNFDRLTFGAAPSRENSRMTTRRTDVPDRNAWNKNITTALGAISKGELGKIVLARKSTIEFSHNVDAFNLFLRLKKVNPDSYHFYFQPKESVVFMGGSPERLYRRNGNLIQSEALAGTRLRGKTVEDDKNLENDLLTCDKDLREHRFVHHNVQSGLDKVCSSVTVAEALKVMKLARIQHLYSSFWGELSQGSSDAEILSVLHPTPAVGGYPTGKAVKILGELEAFDRGWYSGPVGWVGNRQAEFAVAIRSGLVQKNRLSLFSGAGIVDGSQAQAEWEEIEFKITNFIKILNGT